MHLVWTPLEPTGKFLNSFSPFSSFLSAPLLLPPSASCSLSLFSLSLSLCLSLHLSPPPPPPPPLSLSLYLSISIYLSVSVSLSLSLSLSLSCSVLKFLQESNSLKTWQTSQTENNSNLVSWICLETETRINLYMPGCSNPCRICADTQTQAHTYIHSG